MHSTEEDEGKCVRGLRAAVAHYWFPGTTADRRCRASVRVWLGRFIGAAGSEIRQADHALPVVLAGEILLVLCAVAK